MENIKKFLKFITVPKYSTTGHYDPSCARGADLPFSPSPCYKSTWARMGRKTCLSPPRSRCGHLNSSCLSSLSAAVFKPGSLSPSLPICYTMLLVVSLGLPFPVLLTFACSLDLFLEGQLIALGEGWL